MANIFYAQGHPGKATWLRFLGLGFFYMQHGVFSRWSSNEGETSSFPLLLESILNENEVFYMIIKRLTVLSTFHCIVYLWLRGNQVISGHPKESWLSGDWLEVLAIKVSSSTSSVRVIALLRLPWQLSNTLAHWLKAGQKANLINYKNVFGQMMAWDEGNGELLKWIWGPHSVPSALYPVQHKCPPVRKLQVTQKTWLQKRLIFTNK